MGWYHSFIWDQNGTVFCYVGMEVIERLLLYLDSLEVSLVYTVVIYL
jgi:hypothetical protein